MKSRLQTISERKETVFEAKLWCNPYQLISSSSKASRIKELHAERKETVFEFDFPVFALSVTRLVLHYYYYITKGRQNAPVGSWGKSKIFMKNFDCAPVRSVAVVTLERSQSLISNCAVVEKTGTRCSGKLKAPVVMHKSFELERKG